MPTQKNSVLIADSQLLVREGIKFLLSQKANFKVVGEAEESEELIPTIKKLKPEVVVIDFDQPEFFSLDDIEALCLLKPRPKIMVISGNQEKRNILRILELGVKHYILKQCDNEEFHDAFEAIAKDEKFFCGKVIDAIFEKHFPKNEHCEALNISEREREIIQLIADGRTTKQIADILFISEHTVGSHRKNILKKLGLNKASELVAYSIKAGIIEGRS